MWAEKHRPKILSEVRGQDEALGQMQRWARSWSKGTPRQKAILLFGPAGTGKTTAALALGAEMNWDVLEVNASDKRSQSALEELSRSCRTRYSFSGKALKLYVMDEVDGLSGTEDKGGARALSEMIRNTVNPIILICNDLYSPKLRYLRRMAKPIQFGKPRKDAVAAVLRDISRKEDVQPDFIALNLMAERADGDLRSAINDLEAVSMKGKVSREDVRVPEKRKAEGNVFKALDLIFDGYPDSANYARDLDLPPDQLLEWIAENIPLRHTDMADRAEAYDMASLADIQLSRVYRRMHWGFWGYATDIMTRGVGSLADPRARRFFRPYRYVPPRAYAQHRARVAALNPMAEGKAGQGEGEISGIDVSRLIAARCHMSTRTVIADFMPYVKIIHDNNPGMAEAMLRSLGLGDREIVALSGQLGGE